ncbi:MAG: hypothetical protein QXJ07_02525 [Candidatus Bathyarchaeia archaeon]
MIVKSFCVERAVYESLRAISSARGRSISEEVNELLKKRLAELKCGEQPTTPVFNTPIELAKLTKIWYSLTKSKR